MSSDLQIVAVKDGVRTDITEGVRVLYDSIIGSMDWGSGFLSTEEALSILTTGMVCGFETPEAHEYRDLLVALAERFPSIKTRDPKKFAADLLEKLEAGE